jgi:hypothetical protein
MNLIRLVVVDNQNFRQIVMLFKEKYFQKITFAETNVQQTFLNRDQHNLPLHQVKKVPYQILTG